MVEKNKKIKVLDIGYGKSRYTGIYSQKKSEEVTYIDKIRLPHVNIICDISKENLPFKSDSFDFIYINDVLHQIDDIIKVIEECHRVLRKGGRLVIKVPHYSSFNAHRDLLAKHYFTRFSMDYFKIGNKLNFYSKARFEVSCDLVPSGAGRFLPRLIRERACFFINGLIDEVCFEMKAVKRQSK